MQQIHEHYLPKKQAIEQRLRDFSRLSDEDIFYELCFCLLTPQSKGKFCWERVERLRTADFKNKDFNPHSHIKDIRFHNNKNNYLIKAKKQFPMILEHLQMQQDPYQLREWLVQHVEGYGYKEASHFLRNIGHRNLAILDRHILRNLTRYQVIQELPKTLTRKRYLAIEQQFQHFARQLGISMDALDLLFWSEETGEIFK